MILCNGEASVVRLPVRPSVRPFVCKLCANRYFYHKHDSIATKLAHDGPHVGLHPGCAQGQGQGQGQRSHDTDTCDFTKIASSRRQMTGSPPYLHTMVPIRARIQDVLKVKVKIKGHVIRTLVISRKSLLLTGKWLDRDQTCTRWSLSGPASRMCSRSRSRSKVTWYGDLCGVTKLTFSCRQIAGSPPD